MEDIEKLKNIGAREISKHTHMALNKIQNILDSNFAELKDHTTTIGLIKILEREYNVDLQKWQEEYNEFCNNHQEPNPENLESVINFKITHEMTGQNNSKTYIIASAIILVLLGVGFYVYTNFSSNSVKIADTTTSQEPPQTESQTIYSSTEENATSNVENNSTIGEENAKTLANSEPLPTNNSLDASASAPINSQPKNGEQDSLQTTQTTQNNAISTAKHKLEIIPRSNVWVGIVYLDTRKKTSLLTSTALEIDLTRPQTIITGHGMLDLNNNGELTNYNQAEKMLFMVDESGNFSQITLTQYNQHTKGLGW